MPTDNIRNIRMQAKGLYAQGLHDAAKALNEMADAYQYLANEYGRVMQLAGYSESDKAATAHALEWIDPQRRPSDVE